MTIDDHISRRSPRHPLRLAALLLAGVGILGVVLWREHQLGQWKDRPPVMANAPRRLAPTFELGDQHRHVVKLQGYLGRERVALVFMDGRLGPEADPRVQKLLNCADAWRDAGIKVLVVGTASGYENRQAEERGGRSFPFPVLSDVDIHKPYLWPTHREWGLLEEGKTTPRPGLFLIERDGGVRVDAEGRPLPVADEQAALEDLCRGAWPGR